MKNCKYFNLYYISYFIFLFIIFFSKVKFIVNYIKYLKLIFVICLLIYFVFSNKKYKKIKFLLLLFLFLLCSLIYLLSPDNEIVLSFLFILVSKDIIINDFIKYDLSVKIILLPIVFFLFKLGLTNDYIRYRDGLSIVRSSLGFGHPNELAAILFSICLELIYFYRKKMKILIYIISLIITFAIYLITNNRTVPILIFLFLFFSLCIHFFNNTNRKTNLWIDFMIKHSFILFTIFTYIIYIGYINNFPIALKINSLLSNRILCIDYFINNYKINFIGNSFKFIGTEQAKLEGIKAIVLDNSYFHILYSYGIIIYFILAYMLKNMFAKLLKNKESFVILILLIYLIYGISETYFYRICFNPFLIYLSYYFYNNSIFKERGNNK